MYQVQIFIATYNRPQLILKVVASVLQQTFKDFQLFISDNSTNDETGNVLSSVNDERIFYKRRMPSLPVIEHLNAILDDVTGDYFMIFHDDDTMYPEMVAEILQQYGKKPHAVAIGSNAYINKNSKTTDQLFLKDTHHTLSITNSDAVVYQYLIKNGIVPFPSYLYKKIVSEKLRFNPANGGKYCDAAFIMDIVGLGEIVFYNKPLMDYYEHGGQDTKQFTFKDRIKLLNYIYKKTDFKKDNPLIKKFRAGNIYFELKSHMADDGFWVTAKNRFKAIRLLFKNSPFNYFLKLLAVSALSVCNPGKAKYLK